MEGNSLRSAQGDTFVFDAPSFRGLMSTEVVGAAAERVLGEQTSAQCLVPTSTGFRSIASKVLPKKSLIFPGSFNPPHAGHILLAQAAATASDSEVVWFELSVTNADKPSLSVDDIVQRVRHFQKLDNLPTAWGVILTDAPMFTNKVDLFRPYHHVSNGDVKILFAMGTDTLVRLLDCKYYDNSQEKMVDALRAMPCKFSKFVSVCKVSSVRLT